MKKLSVLLSLLVCLMLVVPVSAQSGAWPTAAGTSGVQVVNMDPANSATVVPTYVAENGTVYVLPQQVLAVGGSYTWYAQPSSQTTFRGAVMLSADAAVAAIAKTEWAAGGDLGAAAYSGKSAGALKVSLPLLVVGHYGTTSALTVQNTDMNNDISVNVVFTRGSTSFTRPLAIKKGSSATLDLAFDADFVDPDPGSAGWVGSAVVNSTSVPVVAAAHTTSQSGGFVYAYDGFTALDQTIAYAPLVRRAFYGFTTGIQVADVSGAGGTVTVVYSGEVWNTNGTKTPYTYTDSKAVAPNGSVTFYQGWPYFNDATKSMPDRFLGSAKVSVSAGGAIAVVVNDQSSGTASAYSGFFASEGAASIVSPLARNAFSGFTTGIQIQNVGAGTVNVSVAYTTSPLSSNSTTPPSGAARTLTPGGSTTFYLPLDWGSTATENGWLGSAEFTASGAGEVKVVAITNDQDTVAPLLGDTAIFNCPSK
jgi:hypothetical protein